MTTSDPLDALAGGDRPLAPRPEFAAQLRARLLDELQLAPTQPDPTDLTGSTAMSEPIITRPSMSFYLSVRRASEALAFYEQAFGAEVTMRLDQPDGRVGHAELRIGDFVFSLADEFPEMDIVGPETLGNTTITIELTVPDVDTVFARALAAGATELRPVESQFYGARSGRLQDPFGHRWAISTPVEEVSNDELQRRLDDLYREDG